MERWRDTEVSGLLGHPSNGHKGLELHLHLPLGWEGTKQFLAENWVCGVVGTYTGLHMDAAITAGGFASCTRQLWCVL